ncbi:MAG: TRAP transporter small permease [Planctomycetes bacterium]|jgi:TRAP-type C4-dicarboxylate transport system permease small subunit|nr:TRAP transporter small permease [Planctomycetota bacterium]
MDTCPPEKLSRWRRIERGCIAALKAVVYALMGVACLSVLVMIGTVCADVILRLPWINRSFIGAYDIVRICGALTLAAALPYTTAVKGHVAIEYFFHKLNRTSRIVVDSLMRLLSIALFGFLGWHSILYGLEMFRPPQRVSQTLQIPLFWVPLVIGMCCFVVVLVVMFHLLYPRRELIKP